MKPPRCRACGVEEWRHVCAPSISEVKPSRVTKKAAAPAAKRARPAQASSLKHAVVDMRALGARGGRVGGAVRAARLSPGRRTEIALAAARARWST